MEREGTNEPHLMVRHDERNCHDVPHLQVKTGANTLKGEDTEIASEYTAPSLAGGSLKNAQKLAPY